MELKKILFSLILIIASANAQDREGRTVLPVDVSMECLFESLTGVFNPTDSFYSCTINSTLMGSVFNITRVIPEIHPDNTSLNADVKLLIIGNNVEFFPQNLLAHFPNLEAIKIIGSSFKVLGKDDLQSFANLKYFAIDRSPISTLGDRTFSSNGNLEYIDIVNPLLFFIHERAFDNLTLLTHFQVTALLPCKLELTATSSVAQEILKIKDSCQKSDVLVQRFELNILESTSSISTLKKEAEVKDEKLRELDELKRANENLLNETINAAVVIFNLNTSLNTCEGDKRNLRDQLINLEDICYEAEGNCKLKEETNGYTCTAREIELRVNGDANIVWYGKFTSNKTSEDVLNLVIEDRTFEILPRNVGNSFANLKSFTVRNTTLKSLRRGDFETLHNLTELIITINEITSIEAETFNPLTSLIKLDLTNNAIKTLPRRAFDKLVNLQHLHLNQNSLTSLDENLVPLVNNLKHFLVANNKLWGVDMYLIWRLRNCEKIDFSGNTKCGLSYDKNVVDNFNDFFLSIILGEC